MVSLLFLIAVLIVTIYFNWLPPATPKINPIDLYGSTEPTEKLRYHGNDLYFSDEEYGSILEKHSIYYRELGRDNQKIFIRRLKKFISRKTFIVHDDRGFKEMPILVSATAVQITFGLDGYLLPHFTHIQIYPEEFLRTYPHLCFLEGNVSGSSIRLSWKHFLIGIHNENDGQHVGLHEMAHALYYQHYIAEYHNDNDFKKYFEYFNDENNEIYQLEQAALAGLYSKNAMKNLQEFWAESVEIFFEKPVILYQMYPPVYLAVEEILNQNPMLLLNKTASTDYPG